MQRGMVPAPVEAVIVRLKREYPDWGAPKIREKLREQTLGLLNALKRPAQATEREDLLLFVLLQNVAHLGEELHAPRLRQRRGRRQLIVGFEVSTNCRLWVSTEAVQSLSNESDKVVVAAVLKQAGLKP
jgi:hypothetical protein